MTESQHPQLPPGVPQQHNNGDLEKNEGPQCTAVRRRNITTKNTLTMSLNNNPRDHQRSLMVIKRQQRPHTLVILIGLVAGLAVLSLIATPHLNGETVATSLLSSQSDTQRSSIDGSNVTKHTVALPSSNKAPTAAKKPSSKDGEQEWKWFNGDLNEYYNNLEKDIHNRNPDNVNSFAVHRWLGKDRSTQEHYRLIHEVVTNMTLNKDVLKVMDGGCGLGAGLVWFSEREPRWNLTGYTISDYQYQFITEKLLNDKKYGFEVHLQSYDEVDGRYNVIYSIEAMIHSLDLQHTLTTWKEHLEEGGLVIIIDDFISEKGVNTSSKEVKNELKLFRDSWLANSFVSVQVMTEVAQRCGLTLLQNFDVGEAYEVIKWNYRNTAPTVMKDRRTHQGWLGGKLRQRLTVNGMITYRMLVFQTNDSTTTPNNTPLQRSLSPPPPSSQRVVAPPHASSQQPHCPSIPRTATTNSTKWHIQPHLMSGRGKNGGNKLECISGWYCCDKGKQYISDLNTHRTDHTPYLQLSTDLFNFYLTSFAKHLTDFYATLPEDYKGAFLDIGGTGSVASGMTQVTSKFTHFAGPLAYHILDSDPASAKISNAVTCDIEDCPQVANCTYDVTFSHTVLEHALRPWKAFDTIARITRKGGLTLHLVPWSYQYHATPEDSFRFSHVALRSLLEDRGFEVLEVGYDLCEKPQGMLKRRDEHFDVIWLAYVIARKK